MTSAGQFAPAEWIRYLPPGWRLAKLRHVARTFAGGTPDKTEPDYWDDGTVPWLNSGAVNNWLISEPTTYITDEGFRRSSAKWIPAGSLVMALAGQGKTKGTVARLAEAMTCSQSMAAIVPSPWIDGRFLHWWLHAKYLAVRGLSGGDLRDGLNLDLVGGIPVPVPPLSQQSGIADYLDSETARIDALIVRKRRLVAVNGERAMQAQARLVRGEDGDRERCSSGIDWLGAVPTSWRISRLKFEARLESGHTPSRTRPELWANCTIPWVTLNDVGHMATVEFIEQTTNLISEEGIAASSARVLPAGAVILSRDATIGRSAILAVPMATSQHFANWICSERLEPRYLWLLFRTVMKAHFDSLTDGATLRTIGMPDIRELVVPVPPMEEQQSIVRAAEAVRRREARTRAALLRQIELLVEHRQALITAAVTGELAVPGVAA